ncbi:hypothetical protein HHK36_013346 [Tetracentron sinense]|uniref:Uncharacterized protein n=1 Tax=Tetracentron sinense TaxID=13715 RepID=A0A835DGH6_TETSI|nr:hypothetical protein HHK36_013346 [Tetracentron sinense]
MGITNNDSSLPTTQSHYHTQKVFLLCNYILLGAASSCIFLTLSLRLFPSLAGFFLILLHIVTIVGAVSGCAAASTGTNRWYAAHMVATVLTAIFQGSVSVLIFSRTQDFLGGLKSYVREEDGVVILRMAGGLCVLIFCLEWLVLTLAFFLRYHAFVEGDGGGNSMKRSAKVQEEEMNDWPWPFQLIGKTPMVYLNNIVNGSVAKHRCQAIMESYCSVKDRIGYSIADAEQRSAHHRVAFSSISLRLFSSLAGFFLILLHIVTIVGSVFGCAAALTGLVDGELKLYVREEDGVVILRMGRRWSCDIENGGWVLHADLFAWNGWSSHLHFFLTYFAFVEEAGSGNSMKRSAKFQEEEMNDWPWPFQV